MKTTPSRFIALASFVVLLIIVLAINFTALSSFQSQIKSIPPTLQKSFLTATSTRPANCVPLPYSNRSSSTITPTPDRALGTTPPVAFSPTVTPITYSNTYDLDPSISQEDKGSVIVFRCNGSWDFYWLDPNKNIYQYIPLAEGDYIWMVNPPTSVMGKKPLEITATSVSTITTPTHTTATYSVTSTSMPYPPPLTPEPTGFPYPAPGTSTPQTLP